MISFITATYNRPDHLRVLISSLVAQTDKDWQLVIMDEGENGYVVLEQYEDDRISTHHVDRVVTEARGRGTLGLLAKDAGLKYAKGDFVSFPSEDIYYVPHFVEIMKRTQQETSADLVLCDFLFTAPEYGTYYQHLNGAPKKGQVDSCNYILRKSCIGDTKFGKWVRTPDIGIADGLFIEEIVSKGIKCAKAPGVLTVKN